MLRIFLPKINAGRKKCNFTHGLGQKKCDKYDRIDILPEKLYDYTMKYLADEEAYMESIHYNKLLTYLTEWLVNHILYVDGQIPQE